jgi:hypothetical protein
MTVVQYWLMLYLQDNLMSLFYLVRKIKGKIKQAVGIPPALINQNLNLDNPDL